MNTLKSKFMYNKNKYYIWVFLIISVCTSMACHNENGNEYKGLETRIISEYPVNMSLDKGHLLPINPYGSVDFIGIDSLAIFKIGDGEYLWKIVNLNNPNETCYLFRRGHGENEFSELPASERAFVTDSALYCDFYAPDKRIFYRYNLSASLKQRIPCLEEKKEIKSSDNLQTLYKLADESFFAIKYLGHNGFIRGIWMDGNFKECQGLGNLNKMTVANDINTLASVKGINPFTNMIVEAMIRMHQINLYSVSGDRSLTLSVGDKLQDAIQVDQTSKQFLKKGFANVTCYPDYFIAVYINTSLENFLRRQSGNSQLLVFDWNGYPLAQINVPHMITSSYIYHDKLFILTANDEFYQYDAPKFKQNAF